MLWVDISPLQQIIVSPEDTALQLMLAVVWLDVTAPLICSSITGCSLDSQMKADREALERERVSFCVCVFPVILFLVLTLVSSLCGLWWLYSGFNGGNTTFSFLNVLLLIIFFYQVPEIVYV